MLKPGQIWDRTHMSGARQLALVLKVDKKKVCVYVMDGARAGRCDYWTVVRSMSALLEGRMVQLG